MNQPPHNPADHTPAGAIGHGLVGVESLSPAAFEADGERLGRVIGHLKNLLDGLSATKREIQNDSRLSQAGQEEALREASVKAQRAVAKAVKPLATDLATKLARAREQAGSARRLNLGDIAGTTSRLARNGDSLDGVPKLPTAGTIDAAIVASTIELVRAELLSITDGPRLQAKLFKVFLGDDGGPPDRLAAVSIDKLPRFILDDLASRAAVDFEKLRQQFLAKLDPDTHAMVETLEEVARSLTYNARRATHRIREVLVAGGSTEDVLEGVIAELEQTLRAGDTVKS